MTRKNEIWNQIKKALKSRLPGPEFETWFSKTSLKNLDGESAVISVPNKFVAGWLTERYLTEIEESFKRVLKRATLLHFSYEEGVRPGTPAEEEASGEKAESPLQHGLDPSMTFQSYIAADWNQFASSSALQIAEQVSSPYNPLYIYSLSGLGKTHLLHAIGNHRIAIEPEVSLRYVSAKSFTINFKELWEKESPESFRNQYTELDLLLFDDIHFLSNIPNIQKELAFIFDSLCTANKKIVITADKPPSDLKNVISRLRSRLGSGLVAGIEAPDQNALIPIVRGKAVEKGIHIPDDIVFYLLTASKDMKTLHKNIGKLETYASLVDGDINISIARSLIKVGDNSGIGLEDIKSIIAGYFKITKDDLKSTNRKRTRSYPRQLAMYLARKYTDLSFREIGESFGRKDHSTVIHGINRIEKSKDNNKITRDDLKNIENLLG